MKKNGLWGSIEMSVNQHKEDGSLNFREPNYEAVDFHSRISEVRVVPM